MTVFLSVLLLLILHSTGYCAEWSQGEIEACLDGISTITSNQGVIISQLSSVGVDVTDIENSLNTVKSDISTIKTQTNNIATVLANTYLRLDKINTNIINIYNELDSNQKELLNKLDVNQEELINKLNSNQIELLNKLDFNLNQLILELQKENENILNQLEEIKDILIGSSETVDDYYLRQGSYFWLSPNVSGFSTTATVSFTNQSGTRFAGQGFRDWTSRLDYYFEKGYTYNINISNILVSGSGVGSFYYTYDELTEGNEIYCYYLGNFSQNNFNINITPIKDGHITFFTSNMNPFWYEAVRFSITKTSAGSLSSIGENLNNVNSSINQGNQLQQEQNDFLKQEQSDSDVSIDGFNSVDSNDITSSGLTGVFTNIYNSINSWSSKDISLPIPYTNKSITIPSNYTQNMLSSFGGGWIITFISSIYYFIVARFIIYSITSIINSIKSGSILETDSKNNITTDML